MLWVPGVTHLSLTLVLLPWILELASSSPIFTIHQVCADSITTCLNEEKCCADPIDEMHHVRPARHYCCEPDTLCCREQCCQGPTVICKLNGFKNDTYCIKRKVRFRNGQTI